MKPVNIDNPKTWVKYKPSLCNGCWAGCCTFPVPVTSEDLFHMGLVTEREVNGPLLPIAKRLMKKGIVQKFSPHKGVFVLAQKNGNDCLFLSKQRRCKIYDKRPSVCRRFPDGGRRPGFCPNQDKSLQSLNRTVT